jgi:hypothetical protein
LDASAGLDLSYRALLRIGLFHSPLVHEMTQTSTTRKAWQFSIREFFLVVIAVSSLVALYANQRRFEPTPFSDSFNANSVVDNAMKNLGVAARGGTGGGGSSRSKFVSSSYRVSYQKVDGTRQPIVLEEIRNIIEQRILDAGCKINGTGMTGKVEDDSLAEFEFEYENRDATGQIRVRTTRGDRGNWQFWFDIIEF